MIELQEKGSNTPIGEISEEQLRFLIDQLEEEDLVLVPKGSRISPRS